MTVRTPGPDGSSRLATASTPPAQAPSESPATGSAPKAPRRGGRYAGMSDEEREEIESAIAELWREYKETGEERLRERLILHYSPLVKYVAGRVGVGLPPNIEQADLVSYGIFGLIDAIQKFDLGRAIKFETYAIALIRGAILEMLREEDWVPRSVRDNVKALERTYYQLEVKLGRPATEEEVATEMGLTEAEYLAVTQTLPNLRHTFLIKRPTGSVLCRFDLSAARGKVAVISGRRATYDLMLRLIARHGPDPEVWVPLYEQQAPGIADEPTAGQFKDAAE